METVKKRIPITVTAVLIILNIIYFIILDINGSPENSLYMVSCGAMYEPAIIYGHQYWRFFTAMFMHFGINHIFNNMLVLAMIGVNLEHAMGRIKYLALYLISGIGANAVSFAWNMFEGVIAVSAGASGAIFGVIGATLFAVILNRGRVGDFSLRQIVVLIVCSLFLGFTSSGVDNAAHIAGLVIGFVLAVFLYRRPKTTEEKEISQ